jgi:hypothetical protein
MESRSEDMESVPLYAVSDGVSLYALSTSKDEEGAEKVDFFDQHHASAVLRQINS